jgi:hypothetical protein
MYNLILKAKVTEDGIVEASEVVSLIRSTKGMTLVEFSLTPDDAVVKVRRRVKRWKDNPNVTWKIGKNGTSMVIDVDKTLKKLGTTLVDLHKTTQRVGTLEHAIVASAARTGNKKK